MSSAQAHQLPDYYGVFNVDPMATIEQIEDLFRQLATEAQTSGDHSRVPQAIEAFEVLRDPAKRQQYDHQYSMYRQQQLIQQQQLAQQAQAQQLQMQQLQAQQLQVQQLQAQQAQEQAHVQQAQLEQAHAQQAQQAQLLAPAPTVSFDQPLESPAEQLFNQAVVQQSFADQSQDQQAQLLAPGPTATLEQPPEVPAEQQFAEQTAQQPFADQPQDQPAEAELTENPEGVESETEDGFEDYDDGKGDTDLESELKLSTETLHMHRRELLRIFYERRRKSMKRSGIAIGGLDSLVPYSYDLLEFHLWVLAEKKYIAREESGAFSVSAAGCEQHEQNITEGLITPSL